MLLLKCFHSRGIDFLTFENFLCLKKKIISRVITYFVLGRKNGVQFGTRVYQGEFLRGSRTPLLILFFCLATLAIYVKTATQYERNSSSVHGCIGHNSNYTR